MSMTKSESLEKVNELHSKIVRSSFAENVTESEMLAFIECKKALEKQIPKKYMRKNGNYNCPICNYPVMSVCTRKKKYCDNCGQAIDWSDE